MKAVEQCTQVMNKKNLKVIVLLTLLNELSSVQLWVFPEGTRNRSLDGMLPFKKGAFNVAVQVDFLSFFIIFINHISFRVRFPLYQSLLRPINASTLTMNTISTMMERSLLK